MYLRAYDKKAQYEDKNLIPPEEYRNHWQRYEIVYTKKHRKTGGKASPGRGRRNTFQEVTQTSSRTASTFKNRN